ncbi:MAG TPA: tetratricopeptide repeat protein [Candidatus Sulfotelmatobacter sp.]|jgi:cytochrome c-type biogenesis protein CcmH/NrfG|nr:tetratricopeptide repeat protein [Candidatus Sulfotelmatobacter sp.]
MTHEPTVPSTAGTAWKATQVYAMAIICLAVGLAIGYLFRGSQSPSVPAQPTANAQAAPPANGMAGHMPSLEEMKQMADKKAAPLLEKLKSNPKNTDLLVQVGNIYQTTHRFKEATVYYDQAVQLDPKNVPIRTQLASCMYYNGDVDGAISQLQQALSYDPRDANSLFNLGMIEWQGKQDNKGALAAWQKLLKSNPQLSADRKATVQKLMADVQLQGKS